MAKSKKKKAPVPLDAVPFANLPIEVINLEDVHEDPANARAHNKKNLDAIKSSLLTFGQVEPVIIQKSSGKIIGGNGRFQAMKALGWDQCNAVLLDIDDTKATALGIALNRTAELAEWDDETLASLLENLDAQGVSVDGLGFDDKDMKKLLKSLGDDPEVDTTDKPIKEQYLVMVTCTSEEEQVELLERLNAEGLDVKAMVS